MANMTREELFSTVKAVRKFLKEDLPRFRTVERGQVSPETARDYAGLARSRLDLDQPKTAGRLLDGVSRQSWHKTRAALLYEAERHAREQLRLCDVFQRAWRAGETEAEKAEAFQLAAQAASRARVAAKAVAWVTQQEPPQERSEPKASKRRSLPKSADWRERLYDEATPARKASVAVLWAGVRPAELERGVSLELDQGQVVLTVRGAKCGEHSGQAVRTLYFSPETPLGRALLEHAGAPGKPRKVRRGASRLNKDFAALRKSGKAPEGVSPYSLRHAFCADLKAEKTDPEDIARAMGHASARSQGNYGSVKQGRGGLGLEYVEASRAVRVGWNKGLAASPIKKVHDPFQEAGPGLG